MTLHPRYIPDVPEQTAEVAKAAFRKGNRYIQMRDEVFRMVVADELQRVGDAFDKIVLPDCGHARSILKRGGSRCGILTLPQETPDRIMHRNILSLLIVKSH